MREVVAEVEKPVMLYSIGKDSSVMLHLALKAFAPAPPPFPMLHIASGWNFGAMIAHRDRMVARAQARPDRPPQCRRRGGGHQPVRHADAALHRLMMTEALKAGARQGRLRRSVRRRPARRGKGRAKERIFSFRNAEHRLGPQEPAARAVAALQFARSPAGKACASSRCRTGPSSISGNISRSKTSRSCRSIWRPSARRWSAMA